MKELILITIAACLSINALCQSKPYILVKMSVLKYDKVDPQPAASLSCGISSKFVSLGVGLGVTKFKNAGTYLPLYFEASAFNPRKKVSPYLSFQVGTGIYNDEIKVSTVAVTTSGGLYISPSAGVMFLVNKKHAVLFSVSFISSSFTTKVRYGMNTDTNSVSNGFSVNVGFRL